MKGMVIGLVMERLRHRKGIRFSIISFALWLGIISQDLRLVGGHGNLWTIIGWREESNKYHQEDS